MAPALPPVTQSIGIFSRSSIRMIPTCAIPCANPPPSARPIRGGADTDFTKTPPSSYIRVCNDHATDQSSEGTDRNRIHHVPFLFESPDGGVRTLGHGAGDGFGLGFRRHFPHAQLSDRLDSGADR